MNISGVTAKKAYEISGRVVYAETGEPAPGVMIQYGAMSRDRGVISGWRPNKERSTAEGEFQIQGIPAGKYAIYAHTLPKRELFSDPLIYEITDSGIQGVELRIHRGASISGAVVIEGSNDRGVLSRLSQHQITGFQRLGSPTIPLGDPTGLNADGSFHIRGLQSGKVMISIYVNPNSGGFRVKRVERDGVPQPDGLEIAPGENLSNVRVIVEYGNLTLRGEVKIIGGKFPPNHWVIANATRLNESPPTPCAANVDTRGQFIFENLRPGEYEVRLVSLRYQPGEPLDESLLNLISSVKQKVSIDGPNHAPITLVVDLSRKDSGQ